jgi:hypothetical protein
MKKSYTLYERVRVEGTDEEAIHAFLRKNRYREVEYNHYLSGGRYVIIGERVARRSSWNAVCKEFTRARQQGM